MRRMQILIVETIQIFAQHRQNSPAFQTSISPTTHLLAGRSSIQKSRHTNQLNKCITESRRWAHHTRPESINPSATQKGLLRESRKLCCARFLNAFNDDHHTHHLYANETRPTTPPNQNKLTTAVVHDRVQSTNYTAGESGTRAQPSVWIEWRCDMRDSRKWLWTSRC